MIGACLLQLASFVVTFQGPDSKASFMNSSISGGLSSFYIQFKTTESNTRILTMNDTTQWFIINIKNGYLQIVYNLNGPGNGQKNIDSHLVDTNDWFLLNITSGSTETVFDLIKSNTTTLLTCAAQYKSTMDTRLLGEGFSNLFRSTGLLIGGKTLSYFKGCIGSVNLAGYNLQLVNETFAKQSSYFRVNSTEITHGCPCPMNPCGNNGVYTWDQMKGQCTCKCRIGYYGAKCDMKTESDDDVDDDEFIYIVVGVTVGALIFLTCIVCCILHVRRTSSSVFGVYNPKEQEKIQGQELHVAFTVPTPEKLI